MKKSNELLYGEQMRFHFSTDIFGNVAKQKVYKE